MAAAPAGTGLAPEGPPTPPLHMVSRVLTPAFASALRQSPVLLRQLCGQLFRRHDANGDGVLEREEARALAQELSRTLAVPISPASPLSGGGAPVTLEEFCGWLPRVLGMDVQVSDDEAPGAARGAGPPPRPAEPAAHPLPAQASEAEEPQTARPRRGIAPGYTTALMASPAVLDTLIRCYFRRYDADQSGFLEYSEVLQLTQDIVQVMAVPFMPEGHHLRPSIVQFSATGRDSLSLDEFRLWFPTVLGLEPSGSP
ncbi:unnamed protein product [Prorocentrum cordatum]|uniref:EF-hand domain-containing protein n=1 Tax=Prorocentrum cordatum TaxID=2364126 RepID=A0ABN9WSX6_9DINO|nr:unnamed protein product [Polarella glacialis]